MHQDLGCCDATARSRPFPGLRYGSSEPTGRTVLARPAPEPRSPHGGRGPPSTRVSDVPPPWPFAGRGDVQQRLAAGREGAHSTL